MWQNANKTKRKWNKIQTRQNTKPTYCKCDKMQIEECTKAETGVGAAMAAGNHAEKGIWALMVQAKVTKINIKMNEISLFIFLVNLYLQSTILIIILIQINKPTSHNRLVKAVIMPALSDLDLW